eukprot:GFUD01024946.1.p1 GENE.GFUD01024946.1~~GFUD01024946.1.p1  ORF type:complete len:321 (-),score=74.68 GFUD01024946.1:28-948(-)
MFGSKLRSLARLPASIVNTSKVLRCQVICLHTTTKLQYISNTPSLAELSQLPVQYGVERQVWVENLDTRKEEKTDLIDLHPDVWAVYPRLDIIQANLVWQSKYNVVNYNHVKGVREMIYSYGGGAKPWPQKGTGRARQGSRRAPQMKNPGKVHGPQGPKSLYHMIPYSQRVYGLTHTLSVKMVQDDIHVVDNLEISTSDPEYLLELAKERGWTSSVLFVDTDDMFHENITAATEEIPYMNLMPVYGLNVNSMVKHHTLVLTVRAVESLTAKLLYALNRTDGKERAELSKNGPKEMKLKMEKYRPIV